MSYRSSRRFVSLLGLWLCLSVMTAHAGTLAQGFVMQDNNLSNTLDDTIAVKNLHWYDGANVQFFYVDNPADGSALVGQPLQTYPGFSDPYSIIQAIDNALTTWNGARWGSFKFDPMVAPSSMAPNPNTLATGVTGVAQAEADGINVIDFRGSNLPDSTQVAETWITYMARDFDLNKYYSTKGLNPQFFNVVLTPGGGQNRMVLVNASGNVNMLLPFRKYNAGEIVDVDIMFNANSTPDFVVLPDKASDVPDPSQIPGAYDIQALVTHELGWARGLGNSLITDSTMYARWNTAGSFPTDPYKRRKLSFDDQMTVAMADGTNLLNKGLGAISGQVLNGAVFGAAVDQGTSQNTGTSQTSGGGFDASSPDLFVIQAPVFAALPKAEVPNVPIFADNFDPAPNHPDDVVAQPQGGAAVTYRLLAQVLTGQGLVIPSGGGTTIDVPQGQGGTTGSTGGTTSGNSETVEPGTFDTQANYNGNYLISGLPAADNTGAPLNYGVYLAADLHGSPVTDFVLNPVQHTLAPNNPTYPSEWYGGPNVVPPFGNGSAAVNLNPNDDLFQNNYLSAEFNGDGRFSAAINEGPEILSGYNSNPRSYVVINDGGDVYSNEFQALGTPSLAARIQDAAGTAEGGWEQSGKFSLTTNLSLSDRGGIIGIPAGLLVTHTVRNLSSSTETLSIRQVIDTALMGRENPVYVINGQPVNNSITLTGTQIPSELLYQTSTTDPFLRGFITLSQPGTPMPDQVTIGKLSELGRTITSGGSSLRGVDSESIDTGVALTWGTFTLRPGEVRVMSFIVGFLPPGTLEDTWLPLPTDANAQLTGLEDDPGQVTPVQVTPGQIHDGIDIVTNNGTRTSSDPGNTAKTGAAAGPLQFLLQPNGFPDTSMVTTGGALGDIDGDGDLDLVTSVMAGDTGDATNRIYLNEQRINNDGSVTYYFRDVTYGEDGIPNTPDDRMTPIYPNDQSMGVVLADFDGDGDLDMFITNRGTPNRFYENMGPEKPGFFVERTQEVLPNLLNSDVYDSTRDVPFRATAGDIDGDGDLDLIISQFLPFTDDNQSVAWVDAAPRDPTSYPIGDGHYDATADLVTQPLLYTERVLINQINIPPYAENWNLRHPNRPGNGQSAKRGFYFIDETLGSDDEAGTMTSLQVTVDDDYWERQHLVSWDPSELDRMAPVFPVMYHLGGMNNGGPPLPPPTVVDSPMAAMAVEPRLGPFFGGSGLDLLSIRPYGIKMSWPLDTLYTGAIPGGGSPTDPPSIILGDATYSVTGNYGTQQAYFRNMDLFNNDTGKLGADGIPDGYFACMNYNMDYGEQTGQQFVNSGDVKTGSGLFVYQIVHPASGNPYMIYDAFPLFIGMPEGHPADYTPQPPAYENDLVPPISRTAWAGVIGDWDNSGAPRPFIASDNEASGSLPFTFDPITNHYVMQGMGVNRGEYDNKFGGRANQYLWPMSEYGMTMIDPFNPYQGVTYDASVVPWIEHDVPPGTDTSYPNGLPQAGEPFGVAAGDFNRDGNLDLFLVNSSQTGITTTDETGGLTFHWGPQAKKQVFLGDGFGNFHEVNALSPDNPTNSMYALVGDINNDGAPDLISLNAFSPNELFINQIFRQPPNLSDPKDPTLFYDATPAFLPPVMDAAAAPDFPEMTGAYSSVTNHSAVADLNGDGRPDLLMAEGSMLSMLGDYTRILFNRGEPGADAVPVFQPAGAPYPAPRIAAWAQDFWQGKVNNQLPPFFGYVGQQGYTSDVTTGDVDNDGDPDVVIAHDGSGPELLINEDSDDKLLNAVPDQNHLGDGIFVEHTGWLPVLHDPDNPTAPMQRKWHNRRIKMADFNNDGKIDIVIANGIENSGAENVLLLNSPTQPGHFTDVTETNLPTVTTNGVAHGVFDNTNDVAVGDFNSDGSVDIIFANQTNDAAPTGFRLLLNDGTGHFTETDPGSHIPQFLNMKPQSIVVADFDGLGEPTEDKNHNGILDPGEDTNGNGVIDWVDLPDETKVGDVNNDGIITKRTDGKWDGSLDLFISFDNAPPVILINDPTNQHPGYFTDESLLRFGEGAIPGPNRGAAVGDIDNDGYPDIAVAQFVGGLARPVKLWRNMIQMVDGHPRHGYFTDISYEVPYPRSVGMYSEFYDSTGAAHETDGPTPNSFTGWANDVSLLDVDGDGDLDMFVATQGTTYQTLTQGSLDIFYVNRLNGANWNARLNGLNGIPGSPIVYGVKPRGAQPDTTGLAVEVTGENFSNIIAAIQQQGASFNPLSVLSFGKGVTVTGLTVKDANTLVATINVDKDAVPGPRTVTIQDPGGRAALSKNGLFSVLMAGEPYKNEIPNRVWSLYE